MAGARPARDQREWIQIQERIDRQTMRAVRRMVSGLKVDIEEGNIGTPVPPQPPDSRTPTAPIEVVHDSALYMGLSGQWEGRLIVDFPDVVKATDGTDIEVEVYELWGFKVAANYNTAYPGTSYPDTIYPGADKAFGDDPTITYTLVSQHSQSSFRTDGFTPGDQWRFRVRAVSRNGFYGLWSTQFSTFFDEDDTPPDQPTAPVATALRGVISVTHDGMSVNGPMPADFKYMVLAGGTASSPVTEIARWGRNGGQYVLADIPYYQVWHFRARAVDETGNYGPWSEPVIAYTTPLVDKDIILSELDAATTHLKNINAGVSILENTIIAEHLVATEKLTAKFAQFLTVKADMIDVNSLWTDELFVGVADAVLVRSDMFVGRFFDGGEFRGTTFKTNVEEFRGLTWDKGGVSAYNPSGQRTVRIDAATGDITATQGVLTGLTYQTDLAERTGVKIAASGIRQYDDRGREVVRIGGTDQNLIVGELLTGMPGESRVRISNNNAYGWPAITFIRGGFQEYQAPAIFGRFTVSQPMVYPEIVIMAPSQSIVGGPNYLGLVRIEGDLRLSLGDQHTYNLRSEQPFRIEARSPDGGWHFMGLGSKIMDLVTSDGNITLNSGAKYIMMKGVYDKTTGMPSNLYLAEDGGLFRSVSSRKHKFDIKPLKLDKRLLDVPMVDWHDKFAQEEFERLVEHESWPLTEENASLLDTIQLQRIPGAVAEDVAASGGKEFVTYNAEGEVESLMYDRYALARTHLLHEELRLLRERVMKLESSQR